MRHTAAPSFRNRTPPLPFRCVHRLPAARNPKRSPPQQEALPPASEATPPPARPYSAPRKRRPKAERAAPPRNPFQRRPPPGNCPDRRTTGKAAPQPATRREYARSRLPHLRHFPHRLRCRKAGLRTAAYRCRPLPPLRLRRRYRSIQTLFSWPAVIYIGLSTSRTPHAPASGRAPCRPTG